MRRYRSNHQGRAIWPDRAYPPEMGLPALPPTYGTIHMLWDDAYLICVGASVGVFPGRQAIVIGPTPPGIGVIAPATSTASSYAAPPTRQLPPPSLAIRFIPTSITVAPCLFQSPFTMSARPTTTSRRSALRHTSRRSRVWERASVTVQFSAKKSCAAGRPTRTDRPTTTTSSPRISP
jgi:hypothetical protein